MRSFFGLILLAAGLGIGAYSYFPDAMEDHVRLVQLTRIMTPVASRTDNATPSPRRSFSPSSPLFAQSSTDAEERSPGVSPRRNNGPPTVVAHRDLVRPATGTAIVTPAAMIETAPIHAFSQSGPSPASYTRIVEVQEELKRVGCYHGYLDGDWGPASKRAMQAFIRKVNASLPIDEPDDILLALLKAHASNTCGQGCEPGQIESANGQCVPNTVYASGITSSHPNLIASPRPARRNPTAALSGWEARVNSNDDNDGLPALTAVSEARAALPGRMSVGGPLGDRATPAEGAANGSILPQIKPVPTTDEHEMHTAAVSPPAEPLNAGPVSRAVDRPATVTKRRATSKRYRKETRQKRLMRQAFGDIF